MDYKRIYDAFIKDRREKEPTLTGYTERHHILPKALGGTDARKNLIRLTPEDHFFAHLLLAKNHGGRMWAPIAFMIEGQRKDYKPILSRKNYAWVKQAMSRNLSGQNAHQYDWTIHCLEHRGGRVWRGRQEEMHSVLGMGRSLANLLIKRKIGSAKGWFIEGNKPAQFGQGRSGKHHGMYKHEVITFLHADGRKFVGTQSELCARHGVGESMASRLVCGQFRIANGWYVEGRPPVATGRGSHWLRRAKNPGQQGILPG